eukprot:6135802-Prymnesium_polylepis.1
MNIRNVVCSRSWRTRARCGAQSAPSVHWTPSAHARTMPRALCRTLLAVDEDLDSAARAPPDQPPMCV